MGKRDNRGFTLTEIIIAVAVLTLLLTPIVNQYAQTLKTSRKAKEQQHVNENAEYILEYAQANDITKEVYMPGADASSELSENIKLNANWTGGSNDAITTASGECVLWKLDDSGNPVKMTDPDDASKDLTVKYTSTKVILAPKKFGAARNEFNRTIYMDDLDLAVNGAKINVAEGETSKKYRIVYGAKETPTGWTRTNEGSLMKRDETTGKISAVVVEEVEGISQDNPNSVNLGSVQNLDARTVAIIKGDATAFDRNVETVFYSKMLNQIKVKDPATYDQIVNSQVETVLQTGGVSTEKCTKIYIGQLDASGNPTNDKTKVETYRVTATVYYTASGQFSPAGKTDSYDINAGTSYVAFTQDFKLTECPDIFFEYQPYTKTYSDSLVQYINNDYILMDSNVEDVKLYLYKPTNDQKTVATNNPSTDYANTKIIINKVDSVSKDVKIYTSLPMSNFANTEFKDKFLGSCVDLGVTDESGKKSYDIGEPAVPTVYSYNSVSADSPTYYKDLYDVMKSLCGLRESYDLSYVKPLSEDERFSNRSMSITVVLEPAAGGKNPANAVTLRGAKGGN